MALLVPPDEVRDAPLDADLGPVVELALGPPQVGGRQPHVPRLVGVPLDPHASPQGPSDQLDQPVQPHARRSEEHTSELQSRSDLVCRLLLEKKKEGTQHHDRNFPYRRPRLLRSWRDRSVLNAVLPGYHYELHAASVENYLHSIQACQCAHLL